MAPYNACKAGNEFYYQGVQSMHANMRDYVRLGIITNNVHIVVHNYCVTKHEKTG